MLKVNEAKILDDYAELVDKQEKNLAKIELDAKAYATAHGYDADKTARFVEFTQEIEGNGLSDEENTKLDILDAYIDEVEDEPEKEVDDSPDSASKPTVNPNPAVNVL